MASIAYGYAVGASWLCPDCGTPLVEFHLPGDEWPTRIAEVRDGKEAHVEHDANRCNRACAGIPIGAPGRARA